MLTRLFIYLGWSRDDWKFWWAQIVSLCALVVSGVFDITYWGDYLGLPVSPLVLHWIMALSAFVLWVSARHSATTLPSASAMASGAVPGSPVAKSDDKIDVAKYGPLVLAVLLVSGAWGCATANGRHIATVSVVAAHATLSAVQDTEMLLGPCGKAGVPAPPACVPVDVHRDISHKLVIAFDADAQVARAIRDWPANGPLPSSVGSWLAQITVVVNYVLDHLPPGTLTTKLLAQIGGTK